MIDSRAAPVPLVEGLLSMIRYSLRCAKDHEFEGWFQSSQAFDHQVKKKQIACADCGSTKIEKAPMAPAVAGRRGGGEVDKKNAREVLKAMRDHVEANCDYVGPRFAEEARRIHYGECEARSIYGEASNEQARELSNEGVEFARLPLPRRADC